MKKMILCAAIASLTALSVSASAAAPTDALFVAQGYDLAKQEEKLTNDPSDLKVTDVKKFKYLCKESVFHDAIKREAPKDLKEQVERLCGALDTLHVVQGEFTF